MKKEIPFFYVPKKALVFLLAGFFLTVILDVIIENDIIIITFFWTIFLITALRFGIPKHHLEIISDVERIDVSVIDMRAFKKIKVIIAVVDLESELIIYEKQIQKKYDDLEMKDRIFKAFRYISVIEVKKQRKNIIVRIEDSDISFIYKT